MKKIIAILLVSVMVLGGCSSPVAFAPDGSVIKPTPTKKVNKYNRELPGIKVELPKEEVYSEGLLLESSITNKDIVRLTKESGARRAFDAQLNRETASKVSEAKYEFWKTATAIWFSALLVGFVAWQVRKRLKNREKAPEINPFSEAATQTPKKEENPLRVNPEEKETPQPAESSTEKKGLHADPESSEF